VKIRLHGTAEECDQAAHLLSEVVNVVSLSDPTPTAGTVAWSASMSRSASSPNAGRPHLPTAPRRHAHGSRCTAPTGSYPAADLPPPLHGVLRDAVRGGAVCRPVRSAQLIPGQPETGRCSAAALWASSIHTSPPF
jgi:hypothetical protein